MAKLLSMSQRNMLERINTYHWRRLDKLGITTTNQVLKSLVKRGLAQVRIVNIMDGTQVTEVRRIAMEDAHGQLRESALKLINALPSVTRRTLDKEVDAVLQCIVHQEAQT